MFGFLRDLAFAFRCKGFNVLKDAIPFATPLVEVVADDHNQDGTRIARIKRMKTDQHFDPYHEH